MFSLGYNSISEMDYDTEIEKQAHPENFMPDNGIAFCECTVCGSEIEQHEGHVCECGQEITEKQCKENGGMCDDCIWILANM